MNLINLAKRNFPAILIFLLFAFFLYLMINYHLAFFFLILLGLVFVYLLSFRLDLGIYLMILLYPFIDWQIYLTSSLNLPPVDLLAILLLISFLINRFREGKIFKISLPFWKPFLVFLIISVFSLLGSYFSEANFRYLFRPIIFLYLAYLVLPYNILTSKKVLLKAVKTMFFLGSLVALTGLIYLILNYNQADVFLRAKPITFGSWQPLGNNQNLLAEFLVTVIPLGFLLSQRYRQKHPQFYFSLVGTALMIIIALLTFSRAAWLTLGFQLLALIFLILPGYLTKENLQKIKQVVFKKYLWWLLVLLLPLTIGMFKLSQTYLLYSSNLNRSYQWRVGWEMFSRDPWLGQGLNTFMPILDRDPYYLFEFGSGLEAHGLLLKLLSELGILGVMAFTWFIFLIVRKTVKLLKSLKFEENNFLPLACLSLAAFGVIFFQLFNTSYFTAKMWLPLGLLLAGLNVYGRKKT